MAKESAGLLVYKIVAGRLFVFLAHPGGPFWAKKDLGAWSIPKGELDAGEDPLTAARREFREEIGQAVTGTFAPLKLCRQPGGKTVHAWTVEADVDETQVASNDFEIEWPPRSGRRQWFPEVDRAAWFDLDEARRRIMSGQLPLLNELAERLGLS
jgi:predicted NUDIX family NTP pyrophosphohydrolase